VFRAERGLYSVQLTLLRTSYPYSLNSDHIYCSTTSRCALHYTTTLNRLKGIESDQGYQNYLFYNGHFNTAMGNATLFHQGYGVVNTIGAMNGYR